MRRWWLLALLLMGGLALTVWAVLFWERAKPYDHCLWMPGTQIVRRQVDGRTILGLGESSDRTVLQWSRGLPHSTVTTGHGWSEQLTLELRALKAGTVIHLANDDVRVAYFSYLGRFWNLRPGTAAGTLRIEAVSEDSVTASYDITLTGIDRRYGSNEEIQTSFKGARSFQRRARPKDPMTTVGNAIQEGPLSDTIYRAAERGDTAAVKEFLAKGVSVNAPDSSYLQEDWTPLHHAAFHGRTSVARYLLAEGAAVNGRSKIGNTPLHEAAGRGHVSVVELLLTEGADVNATNNRERPSGTGLTPLDCATGWHDEPHDAIAALLREHGAK
ncbi:hypothetical protein LCGC14_2166590 [marine sediment metagenome]|uniref:Uncharacterized protein n=1 Tax=marine sediment metagenome TaxID=412755 RepID=A0A0F9DR74_9ZZZZ